MPAGTFMRELRIRITVEHPPAGVAIQVQRGRDGLLPPVRSGKEALSFELSVRLGDPRAPGKLRLLGEYVQGPPDARFVYVNSGTRAGQTGTCWDRRAKVPLTGISLDLARRVLEDDSLALEARVAGTARDGGPLCASVPLLGGWTITRRSMRRARR